jgi:hypothetical protein
MDSAAIPERFRSLHSTYVGELQELFTSADLPYGSPRDIAAAVQRMRQPGTFADEFRCIVRSIVLREGGSISHSQLMEILTLAISGPAAGPVLDREPAAAPSSRPALPPQTAVASFLPRFSPPALGKVLLASVSLVLFAESLFLFLHRDALIPVRLPTPAAEPRPASAAPAAVSAAAESAQAAPRSEPAAFPQSSSQAFSLWRSLRSPSNSADTPASRQQIRFGLRGPAPRSSGIHQPQCDPRGQCRCQTAESP